MDPSTRRPDRVKLWLFLTAFFFFMLTGSRERPWADATPIWQVADALVTRGEINITTAWPPTLPRGRDGKIYGAAPLIQPLSQVPAAALMQVVKRIGPAAVDEAWPLASHLAPAALGALTCVLFFGLQRQLGVSAAAAWLSIATLGFATTVWVYARYPYSEILQAACFTGFFSQMLAVRNQEFRRGLVLLGVWAGLLLNAKLVYILVLPGALLYLIWYLRNEPRRLLKAIGWAAVGMSPFLVLILVYNWARWGSALVTGYESRGEPARSENLLFGLWGLLLSPGKSVFLYSPALLLTLAAIRRAATRWPHVLWLMLATVVPVLLYTAQLPFWSGDYAWGPRYLVFAVPVLLVPVGLVFEDLLARLPGWPRRLRCGAVAVLLAMGVFVQVVGNAFFWDHFIRIQREARNNWLGAPNKSGTRFPDFGGGICGACFEDMHGMQWLPAFQPIEGHWWLLRHVASGHDWVNAEVDAPWRRYTTLRVDISRTYPAARIDWWFLEYGPGRRAPWVILLILMSVGTVGAGWFLARELRRLRAREGEE